VFSGCTGLSNIAFPASVSNIGDFTFQYCNNLAGVYFAGNPPNFGSDVFFFDNTTLYYLPGSTGWTSTVDGVHAVLWNPAIQAGSTGFVQGNLFAFTITGTSNIPIVLEASTDLSSPAWIPLQTLTLTNGSFFFSEPLQANGSGRFYRVSSP
jgi:hypothetical protein